MDFAKIVVIVILLAVLLALIGVVVSEVIPLIEAARAQSLATLSANQSDGSASVADSSAGDIAATVISRFVSGELVNLATIAGALLGVLLLVGLLTVVLK